MEAGSLSCEAHATSTAAQIQQLLDELTARREVSDARSRRQISQTLLPVLYWGQLQQGDMLLVHRKKDMSGVPGLGDIDHYGIFTGQDWPTGPAVVHSGKFRLSTLRWHRVQAVLPSRFSLRAGVAVAP